MPLERAIWKLEAAGPVSVQVGGIDLERRIEDAVEADPSIVDSDLLIIGRQVTTDHSGGIDLLALDSQGEVVIIELKRSRTPRDVVAQTLDYGAWVSTLGLDDLRDIWSDYSSEAISLDDAFADRFNWQLEDPDGSHRLLIVASELDASTERIVNYLNDHWEVPVNVALFGYFEDAGSEYLIRNWLRDPVADSPEQARQTRRREQAPWDGRTWVVNFGDDGQRSWEDARRYGFVTAGGGEWYVRTLRNLKSGVRVACIIPGVGYVGVGTVSATVRRIDDAMVDVSGAQTPVLDLELSALNP